MLRCLLPILLLFSLSSFAEERRERNADRAALSALTKAISKLKKSYDQRLLSTNEREKYLVKLAEMQITKADFLFRIDHAESYFKKEKLTLKKSKKAYQDAVDTLTRFLSLHPKSVRAPWALLSRGKAYEEMEEEKHATADYLRFVAIYPDNSKCDTAYMSLASYANKNDNIPLAIKYLLEVEKNDTSPYYLPALHELAWANYNLRRIRPALDYLHRHLKILIDTEDLEFAENAAGDLALFYLDGLEKDPSEFSVEGAYKEIHKTLNGELAERSYTRFARLLKAHGHLGALSKWRDLIFSKTGPTEATYEISGFVLGERFARRDWKLLGDGIHDLLNASTKENLSKAEKTLMEMADEIQKMIMRNLAATDVGVLSKALRTVYDALIETMDKDSPKVAQIHYNLAEAFFRTAEYSSATERYRIALGKIPDAGLKAISSRHFELKKAGLIPTSLSATAKFNERSVPNLLREWITWIDAEKITKKTAPEMENFLFDAARSLYALGQKDESLKRLTWIAEKANNPKLRLAAGALVLDTYVVAADWKKVNETAEEFRTRKDWGDEEFKVKLDTLAADSFFQLTVAAASKSPEERLAASSECLKKYSTGKHAAECALLAGKAAIELGKKDEAKSLLANAGDLRGALLLRAGLQEAEADLTGAITSLMKSLTKTPDEAVRKQVLGLSWVSGDSKKIEEVLKSPLICGGANPPKDCETYRLIHMFWSRKGSTWKEAFKNSLHAAPEYRSLWAIHALNLVKGKTISFQDRLVLMKRIGDHWKNVPDSMVPLLAGECDRVIAESVELTEKSVPRIAPVSADENALLKRMKLIQEAEKSMGMASNVPFARTKLRLLVSVAKMYRGFVKDLNGLIQTHAELKEPLSPLLKPLEGKIGSLEDKIKDSDPSLLESATFGVPYPVSSYWKEAHGLELQALFYQSSLEKNKSRAEILRGLAFVEAGAAAEGAQLLSENFGDLSSREKTIVSWIVLTRNWEAVPRPLIRTFAQEIRTSRSLASEESRSQVMKAIKEANIFEGGSK